MNNAERAALCAELRETKAQLRRLAVMVPDESDDKSLYLTAATALEADAALIAELVEVLTECADWCAAFTDEGDMQETVRKARATLAKVKP